MWFCLRNNLSYIRVRDACRKIVAITSLEAASVIADQTNGSPCKLCVEYIFKLPQIRQTNNNTIFSELCMRVGTCLASIALRSHSYIFNVRCLSTFLSYAGFSGAINYLSSKTRLFSNFCCSLPTSSELLSKLRIFLSYCIMYYRAIIFKKAFTQLITVSTEKRSRLRYLVTSLYVLLYLVTVFGLLTHSEITERVNHENLTFFVLLG